MFVIAGPPPPRPSEVRRMIEDTCLDDQVPLRPNIQALRVV